MVTKLYTKHVLIFNINIPDGRYHYCHLENEDVEARDLIHNKWRCSNSKPYILCPNPMIFTKVQVPITMVFNSDWYIAKLLCKRVEEKNGMSKGYNLTKLKQTFFFFFWSLLVTTSWLIFAHTLIDWSFSSLPDITLKYFLGIYPNRKGEKKWFCTPTQRKYKVKRRQAT